jgi:hypothetical protein
MGYNAVGRTKAPEQQKAQTGGDDETWAEGKQARERVTKMARCAGGTRRTRLRAVKAQRMRKRAAGQGHCRVGPSAEEAISR